MFVVMFACTLCCIRWFQLLYLTLWVEFENVTIQLNVVHVELSESGFESVDKILDV